MTTMDSKTEYCFDKKKPERQQGKVPEAALQNRKKGPTNIEYIMDKAKRENVRHTRKQGLFKKALEYATMTGDEIRLEIRGFYFDSREKGLVRDVHGQPVLTVHTAQLSVVVAPQAQPSVVVSTPAQPDVAESEAQPCMPVTEAQPTPTPGSNEVQPTTSQSSVPVQIPSCSNAALSPKAVRGKKRQRLTSAKNVGSPATVDSGVQCCLLEGVNYSGIETDCRVCGAAYDTQSRNKQKLWLGCDIKDCTYWLEAKCLLGHSGRLTPTLLKSIPYRCPVHRECAK